MRNSILSALEDRILLTDGEMKSELQPLGLKPSDCAEHWNVSRPEEVTSIHRAYVEAGAEILLTNTFGGCRTSLERFGYDEFVASINRAGAQVARDALASSQRSQGFILGDIGPFGDLMEPFGQMSADVVRELIGEQAALLVKAGVDGIIIESQSQLEETAVAIEAALEAGAACVVASFAFDVNLQGEDVATMMGNSPEQAAVVCQSAGAHILGLKCGTLVDMRWATRITQRFKACCDLPIMAQPNAGTPRVAGTQLVYRESPEDMASGLPALIDAGARIVGGCCGTTPAHIVAMRSQLDEIAAAR